MTSRTASVAVLSLSALVLTACGSEPDPAVEETVDPYAAVSPEDEGQESAPDEQASVVDAAGPAGLSEEQILQVLLDEGDLPLEADSVSENTGTEYFHQNMGVNQGRYTAGFGEFECAASMDAVNTDLIGEAPVEGAIREADYAEDGASLVVWMLSYEEPAASAPVWDHLLAACEGSVLENGADVVEFEAFGHEDFSGMTMQMSLQDDSSVEGYFATLDHGHNVLMISALNLQEDVFLEVVEAQSRKLEQFEDDDAG